jgi:hypothetical protein
VVINGKKPKAQEPRLKGFIVRPLCPFIVHCSRSRFIVRSSFLFYNTDWHLMEATYVSSTE